LTLDRRQSLAGVVGIDRAPKWGERAPGRTLNPATETPSR